MKTTCKKLMSLNYSYYKEIEKKLEARAKKGYILQKIGGTFWTFTKTEPQNLKYTVTYFDEGSIFNPHPTDNQLTYIEYAAAAGWDYVCEQNKMQIFSSSAENPTPFETDEKEQLKNIHTCMKKSFVFPEVLLLVMFLFNFVLRTESMFSRPTDFFSSKTDVITAFLFLDTIIFITYNLINYYVWYYKSKKSVALGMGCVNTFSKKKKAFEILCLAISLFLLGYMVLELFEYTNYLLIAIAFAQVPIFALVYWGSIKLLKKFNVSAKSNKIISISLLILTSILYIFFIFFAISKFDFPERTYKQYTSVEWEIFEGETREHRIYQDEIPLTCQDLYGEIDYDQYSYLETLESTFLLSKKVYSQSSFMAEDPTPRLSYAIYTPKFEFVYDLIVSELTHIEGWMRVSPEPIDNAIFGTQKAYIFRYVYGDTDEYVGEYILLFDEEIIHIIADDPFTPEQTEVVKNALSPSV